MKINPKLGIDQLLFGMKQKDVVALYGKPDKQFNDEDQNVIYLYNTKMVRITFYSEEELKLGYLICSNPDLELNGKKVIGKKINELKQDLKDKSFTEWEHEDFDSLENHFNEANWLIFQTEFNHVVKVELGAIINNKDEFDWQFNSK